MFLSTWHAKVLQVSNPFVFCLFCVCSLMLVDSSCAAAVFVVLRSPVTSTRDCPVAVVNVRINCRLARLVVCAFLSMIAFNCSPFLMPSLTASAVYSLTIHFSRSHDTLVLSPLSFMQPPPIAASIFFVRGCSFRKAFNCSWRFHLQIFRPASKQF